MARKSRIQSRVCQLRSQKTFPKLDRRLLVESLEQRALMAADLGWAETVSLESINKLDEVGKSDIAATHYYNADGQSHGMVILSDRLAISRTSQEASLADEFALETFGLTELRPLDGDFKVYGSSQPVTQEFVDSLISGGWADSVVPVFGMLESGSEAVLLNEAIISLPQGVDASEFFAQSTFTSYRRLDGTPDQFVATLSAGYGEDALEAINDLSNDQRITWTSPNFYQNWQKFQYFTNDPRLSSQWHLHNTGQGGGLVDADPNLPEAWQVFQPAGPPSSIVIGVVDDGVSNDHPDIFNRLNPGEVGNDNIDNDGNGWIDDVNGWNFVANNKNSQPTTSTDNHATSVAGVAAARGDNSLGVAGASYNSSVISSRIFEGSSVASDANIASAIYYTAGRTQDGLGTWSAAHIMNHSWGGGGASTAITGAVTWATTSGRGGLGVPQLFAAGNSFGSVIYPATLSLTNPGVIAVGALNNFGEKSNYSSFGAPVDIVTPSNDTRAGYLAIDTTDRLGSAGYNTSAGTAGDYTGTGSSGFGGTSSATPLATGIGALALARASQLGVTLTAADLKSLMRNNTKLVGSTAYALPGARNDLLGYGLLNAERLVKGIGTAQVSVTTDRVVLDAGGTVDLGSALVGGVTEATFRVRNQGTTTLNLSGLSISSADFTISEELGATSLALGESTTFVVRFSPTTAGVKTGTVTLSSNDSQLPSLIFDVSGLAQATTISGYFFEDYDGNGILNVGEPTVAGHTVFIDQNNNGVFDAAIQSSNQTNSTPAAISDNQTTTSVINVSGLTVAVTDVNVTVNLTHTYLGDLTIFLVGPEGTRVQLFNRRGGSADNLVNTVFDDQAATAVSAGTAPFTGSFRPEEALSNFNTIAPNGNWTLEVTDNAGSDQGTLTSWTLSISGGERSTTSDSFGFYYFLDVPNGSYTAIRSVLSGWTGSGSNQHPFTVTGPNDSFADRHFGAGKNDRFYARVFDDQNGNGLVNGSEAGLGGRTVFLDANSNGIFDPPVESNPTNSTSTPITDNSTIEMPITVAGFAGLITDVDVSVNLNHTYDGDLEISLLTPSGGQIMLSNRRGGSSDNFTNTRFDDSAAQSILDGTAPFTGSFRPEGLLSQLNGQSANGLWRLRIRDLAGADQGTFLNWTLHLKSQVDLNVDTDSNGWAPIDLPSGTSSIALVAQAGWEFTVPVNGIRQGTANGTPYYNQLYGTREPVEGILDSYVYHTGYSGAGSAIDSSKSLAKQGDSPQLLTFDNLINSSRGINGIGFELQNIPANLTASDFVFQMSPTGAFLEGGNPPASWTTAPAPASINVTQGATDSVLIQWNDNAIANRWLRVTVLANANTGLSEAEIYYVGHLLGETTGESGGVFTVAFADITPIRGAVGQSVGSDSIVDIDKNGTVAFADISAMRSNIGAQLTAITIPGSGGGGSLFSLSSEGNTGKRAGSDLSFNKLGAGLSAPVTDLSSSSTAMNSIFVNVDSRRGDRGVLSSPVNHGKASSMLLANSQSLPFRSVATIERKRDAVSSASRRENVGFAQSVDGYFADIADDDGLLSIDL